MLARIAPSFLCVFYFSNKCVLHFTDFICESSQCIKLINVKEATSTFIFVMILFVLLPKVALEEKWHVLNVFPSRLLKLVGDALLELWSCQPKASPLPKIKSSAFGAGEVEVTMKGVFGGNAF